MWVSHLALTDFRNYRHCDIELTPGVTLIVGSNGQGKTNLVEALAYQATFASHRVATDAPLVRHGADCAIIRTTVVRPDRTLGLDVQINPGRANRVQVNRSPVRRTRDALGLLRVVVFAPEDLALVKGDPAGRRRFLDSLLVQTAPRYAGVIADYEKSLRQRNSLLRGAARTVGSAREALDGTLGVWDDRLVLFGADLIHGRRTLLATMRDDIAAAYAQVAAADQQAEADYRAARLPGIPDDPSAIAELMRRALAENRAEEVARGVTVVGPHRDDVDLTLNGLPARGYASHGECWSLALSLRLASMQTMRQVTDAAGDPVLVLDDVFAELDVGRRQRLADVIEQGEQVLITAAVSNDVPTSLGGVRFSVEDATVEAADRT